MRPRHESWRLVVCLTALAAVLVSAGAAVSVGEPSSPAERWRSAFEARPAVDLGGRSIVVLVAPSLADRMAGAEQPLAPKAQRRIVRNAEAFQRRLLRALRAQGVKIVPERSYTRTFNGFSAVLDARALAALERAPGVVGVYPVRPVYPAFVSSDVLARPEFGPGGGHRAGVSLADADGTGVTIALLDTGVDRRHPSLRGGVARGLDLVDGRGAADQPEAHGTRMAGLLVGSEPLAGAAPGATVLPLRVLAPALDGDVLGSAGRSDVLLEGLERAVDPNADGAVGDAADVALAAVVEPYASFADAPEARAVAGAAALGTLVVSAAGNDGPAGGGFGTIAAPGGAPAALTVGAADARIETLAVPVSVTAGGQEVWAGETRVLGAVAPAPGRLTRVQLAAVPADGTAVAPRVRAAVAAGAETVLVYGSGLPAGALDLEDRTAVPIVALPLEAGEAVAAAIERGWGVDLDVGEVVTRTNPDVATVAPFSSRGPGLGGHAKPDLVAAGVGLATADAGGGFATVTGTSAAAAVTAGAAALLAQARPELGAAGLASALVSSARPLDGEPFVSQGAGLVDVTRAAGAELVAEPATLAVGQLRPGDAAVQATLVLRNVSERPIRARLSAEVAEGAPSSAVLDPEVVTLRPGAQRELTVSVSAASAGVLAGSIVARAAGEELLRVPWLATAVSARPKLVRILDLSARSLAPSARKPAVLTVRIGRIRGTAGALSIEPVSLLEVELLNARGKRVGVLARLRDLLPGQYSIGLTGRGPQGAKLAPGRYAVRLVAHSADFGEGAAAYTTRDSIGFRIGRS
jgi:minor extracellular serine protease Vpr